MAIVLLIAITLLVFVVVTAQRHVPGFDSLFEGLGSPLPPITPALIASYRWWWWAPFAFTLLAIDVLRRPKPSVLSFGIVVTSTFVVAFVLPTWTYEASFRPIMDLLEAIGRVERLRNGLPVECHLVRPV